MSGVTATLVPLQTIKQQSTYANTHYFIVITSFVNSKDAKTNTVSKTLQVIISQVTLLSLQIRSIAATANDIADRTNMNLTNFIALCILSYYYLLYDCVHCKQHEHLEKKLTRNLNTMLPKLL